ncbi:hypothetical protein XELAEV_18038766mg [Xenopus laevis]|uniref:Uncharacterized protein n=1 Tax=Xenopus laevis TaxID=8355 RepID=A0A974C677_XENLA|nr:hypothetical protein XELAEV_18038766mg [Xenopus laevis]
MRDPCSVGMDCRPICQHRGCSGNEAASLVFCSRRLHFVNGLLIKALFVQLGSHSSPPNPSPLPSSHPLSFIPLRAMLLFTSHIC